MIPSIILNTLRTKHGNIIKLHIQSFIFKNKRVNSVILRSGYPQKNLPVTYTKFQNKSS
jgi:hypothetical protein